MTAMLKLGVGFAGTVQIKMQPNFLKPAWQVLPRKKAACMLCKSASIVSQWISPHWSLRDPGSPWYPGQPRATTIRV